MITRERSCDRKLRYASQEDADYAASRTRERNVRERGDWRPLVAYECSYGQHWHIGHQARAGEV